LLKIRRTRGQRRENNKAGGRILGISGESNKGAIKRGLVIGCPI